MSPTLTKTRTTCVSASPFDALDDDVVRQIFAMALFKAVESCPVYFDGTELYGDSKIGYKRLRLIYERWKRENQSFAKALANEEAFWYMACSVFGFVLSYKGVIGHPAPHDTTFRMFYTMQPSRRDYLSSLDCETDSIGGPIVRFCEYCGEVHCFSTSPINTFSGQISCSLTALPSNLTCIGRCAFANCTNLTLNAPNAMPNTLRTIADTAFFQCVNLTIDKLPNSVHFIGYRAFEGCSKLALKKLPLHLTCIDESTFRGCTSLALETLSNKITSIDARAFEGCTHLALTELPTSLTSIGDFAFDDCEHLALTELPTSLESIGDCAFRGCWNLALQELPSGVLVGASAFLDSACDDGFGNFRAARSDDVLEVEFEAAKRLRFAAMGLAVD